MINRNAHKIIHLAAICIGCFFMVACENDVNAVKELGAKTTSIEEGIQIESYLSNEGKISAKLTAPLLLRYQGDSARKAEFPKSLHVDFFDDSLKLESKLDAKYGRYLENDRKVYLRDSVVVFNLKGDTLFCKELYWNQGTEQFFTDKEVTLVQTYPYKQKGKYANGFTSNQNLTNIVFFTVLPGSYAVLPDSVLSK